MKLKHITLSENKLPESRLLMDGQKEKIDNKDKKKKNNLNENKLEKRKKKEFKRQKKKQFQKKTISLKLNFREKRKSLVLRK